MCEKFHQLGRWFPPGTPVSSTRKLISSSSFHRLDMTLAVGEALNPNKPNVTDILLLTLIYVYNDVYVNKTRNCSVRAGRIPLLQRK